MAKEYFQKLESLVKRLNLEADVDFKIEVKHFFSGAALYVKKTICVSWSPVGLAFKLPEAEVLELINSGEAKELKYFPKGHVKQGYALFENPEKQNSEHWKKLFIKASKQVEK